MPDVHVTVLLNGPLRVARDLEIVDAEGRRIDPPASMVQLCRCGLSAKKPFCDGSHARRANC